MHQYSRSARRGKCWSGRLTGRPRYSARRAKVGFGGECGNSRAARADGAGIWVYKRRSEQLARTQRDWAAHTTALGTADAGKWVKRQEHCLTQPRATISINLPTGPCGRPAAEAAARRRGPSPHRKFLAGEGGTRRASFLGGVATPWLSQMSLVSLSSSRLHRTVGLFLLASLGTCTSKCGAVRQPQPPHFVRCAVAVSS